MTQYIELDVISSEGEMSLGSANLRTVFDTRKHVVDEWHSGPLHVVVETAENPKDITTVAYVGVLTAPGIYGFSLNSPRYYVRTKKEKALIGAMTQHTQAITSPSYFNWLKARLADVGQGGAV